MKAFISWSGGKDSCLALHRSLAKGLPINSLLCMLHENGRYSRSHGISLDLLTAQAESLGFPVHFGSATWENYEAVFKDRVRFLKSEGVDTGIFGDIDLPEHRSWVEKVCRELELEPLLPLWGEERKKLAREFINLGYRALIVSVRTDVLDGDWLGRTFDLAALRDLEERGIDPCGEGGEFHTFVFSGPLFSYPLDLDKGSVLERHGHLQLELFPMR